MVTRTRMHIGLDGAPTWAYDKQRMADRLAQDLDAFTLTLGMGAWKGETEASWLVEVLHTDGIEQDPQDVRTLADLLEADLNQDVILVTQDEIQVVEAA